MDYNSMMVIQSFIKRHKYDDILTNRSRNILWLIFMVCDSCGDEYDDYGRMGYDIFMFGRQTPASCKNVLPPIQVGVLSSELIFLFTSLWWATLLHSECMHHAVGLFCLTSLLML